MRGLIHKLQDRYRLGEVEHKRPDLTFVTVRQDEVRAILTEMRDVEGFTHLVLLTAVDWIEDHLFQLTYLLNNRGENQTVGLRVMIDRDGARGETIHDLWPTAAVYQRELREMFGIDFPGSPRVDEEFMLEGWTDLPPYRRDFDSLGYSQQTYNDRPGRENTDPRVHMQQQMYPDPGKGGA